MKRNSITKALFFTLLFCAGMFALKSCKKNDAALYETDAITQFTKRINTDNPAVEKVITDVKLQLAQKDFSADFLRWHGQPLWDKAVTLQKDAGNFILLVPTQKNNNIEAFISVRLKNGRLDYEVHRRSAMDKKITEPSWMNITDRFRQSMLAYFNNSILGKVDNTDVPPSKATASRGASGNEPQSERYIQICYHVGYCGPDACPPNAPEGGVCCTTYQVCSNIWLSDDGGGVGGGGPGSGGGGGGWGPPPPDPCPAASWYSQNPAPIGGGGGTGGGDPCGVVEEDCETAFNKLVNGTHIASQLTSVTTIEENSASRIKNYQWICLVNYGGWGLLSTEQGKHKKVINSNPDLQWEWDTFTHFNMQKYGITIGGQVTYNAVGTATIGRFHAVMDLDITVEFHPICKYVPGLPLNYRANKMFNINDASIVQGY